MELPTSAGQERKQTVVRAMRSPTQYSVSSSQLQEQQQQRDGPTTIRTVVSPRGQSTSPSAGVRAYPNNRHSPASTTAASRTSPVRSVSDHFGSASSSQLQEQQQQRDGPTTIRTVVSPRGQSTSPSAGVRAYPNNRHSPASTTATSRTSPVRSVSDHFGGARGISSPEESDSAGNALFRARSLQQNSPVGRDSRKAGAQWATSAHNTSSARSVISEPESEPDASSVTEDIPEDVCSRVMPSCANRRRCCLARVRSCCGRHRKCSPDPWRLSCLSPSAHPIGTIRA